MLKLAQDSSPVSTPPDYTKPLIIITDASDKDIGVTAKSDVKIPLKDKDTVFNRFLSVPAITNPRTKFYKELSDYFTES